MEVVKSWFPIAIRVAIKFSICVVLVLAQSLAVASSPGELARMALQERLALLDNVIADFEQQMINAQGYLTESSKGTLYLAKPKFRWEVFAPFPQIIIADNERIEIYDPDLEQVTQRTLSDALHEAPLALLTQSDLRLEGYFSVYANGETFVLLPNSDEALFDRLEITFVDDQLSALDIHDHTGQQTLIRFSNYRAQQVLQSDLFELDYPDGTDFVRG